MPKQYPDNSALLDYMKLEFNHTKENLNRIEKHLEKLNGQVAKHTEWVAKNGDEVPLNTKARGNLRVYWLSGVMVAGGVGGAAGGEVKALLGVLLSTFAGT